MQPQKATTAALSQQLRVVCRQASLTMGTGPYVPSGLAPTTSLTSATLAAAAEQETASDATSPFRPQAAADLTRVSAEQTLSNGHPLEAWTQQIYLC